MQSDSSYSQTIILPTPQAQQSCNTNLLRTTYPRPRPVNHRSHRRPHALCRTHRNRRLILLDRSTTGVHRPATARAHEDDRRVDRREEPEERIDEVDPDSVLHADLTTLLRSWVRGYVHVAEQAEEGDPEDTADIFVSKVQPNCRGAPLSREGIPDLRRHRGSDYLCRATKSADLRRRVVTYKSTQSHPKAQ